MDKEDPGKLETYAIVEVMGHNRFAGYVQQVPMGGAAMIRVDVPEIPGTPSTGGGAPER